MHSASLQHVIGPFFPMWAATGNRASKRGRRQAVSNLRSIAKAILPNKYHAAVSDIYASLRSLFYLGKSFTCPCCGRRFRKLLTHGIIPRPNARCPRCGSLERHRLLWLYYQQETNLFSENLKVLHFAPEHAFQKVFRRLPNLHYTSADLSKPAAMVKMDMTNIPCATHTFDVVLCNHVLEHIQEDEKAMREMFRVLKPGGRAIIQTPVDPQAAETLEDAGVVSPQDRERLFGHSEHVRVYGRDLTERLARVGFIVNVENYSEQLGNHKIKEFALANYADLYLDIYQCKKPELSDQL